MGQLQKNLPEWLGRIDQGDLTQWTGWKADWRLADILKVLHPNGSPQPCRLGGRDLLDHAFALTHQPQPLHVMADSLGNVVLVRLEDALLTQPAGALEATWGASAAKMELPTDHRFAPAQLWVFPARGVSLYVLDPQQSGPLSLSAIALFGATSLEGYLRDMEGDERVRMWEDGLGANQFYPR